MTGKLHLQIHPSAVKEIIIQPISESLSSGRKDVLFSKGAHLKDLKEVRELIYRLQRPGIAPNLVYAHDWKEKDFCLFHNQASCEAVLQIPTYWRHRECFTLWWALSRRKKSACFINAILQLPQIQ